MMMLLFGRSTGVKSLVTRLALSRVSGFSSEAYGVGNMMDGITIEGSPDKWKNHEGTYSNKTHFSPVPSIGTRSDGYDIEVVDNDTWRVSSGLSHVWGRSNEDQVDSKSVTQVSDKEADDDQDFAEIDDMRIRGDLFYKLDRDSKEFEEYSFDFHRKKSPKRKDDPKVNEKDSLKKNSTSKKGKEQENPSRNLVSEVEKFPKVIKSGRVYTLLGNEDGTGGAMTKKARAPTFNQLTGPYHEPFCLDIFISKASVRACIIHRATSKVVAVAHSISKDMKFDLPSTRNPVACAAVGKILAQRALADDIHDAIYTPRKGERLEGKLQIVLQSIIDNGINVKVKIRQRKRKKASFPCIA